MCVLYCIFVVLLRAWWGGPDGIEILSLEHILLQFTVGWVIPVKIRPRYDLRPIMCLVGR